MLLFQQAVEWARNILDKYGLGRGCTRPDPRKVRELLNEYQKAGQLGKRQRKLVLDASQVSGCLGFSHVCALHRG